MNARTGSRTAMFIRLLMRATMVKPGRVLSALIAVVVAAAVATAMMNLYVDVQAKLRKEFRNYGANVIVVAREGQVLPADVMSRVEGVLGNRGIAVPFAFAVVRTDTGAPVVVAGADMERVCKLDAWWSVTSWPTGNNSALVGARALPIVSPDRKPFVLSFEQRKLQLVPAGTLRTGAAEDSRVYLDLPQFTTWTGVQPSTIEIGATGSPEEISALIKQLSSVLPAAEVKPVRQIMEGEARVLGKTRAALLAAVAMIILTAALCVLATLTAWVLDRRRDFAIMKALGASERLVNGFFAAEAAALGAVGAVLGFAVGIGVAAWIGRANFHAAVVPRFSVFPVVFAGSIGVALISAALPISLLRRVQPATILRGE